jgi:hypothetical protein
MSPLIHGPRLAMTRTVLRPERTRLSALRTTLIVLSVSLAAGIGVSALACYLASGHHASFTVASRATWKPAALSLDGVQLAGLALVVLVVLVIISESCWSSRRPVPPSSSARP